MIQELQDASTQVLHDTFQAWRRNNPNGLFLTLETKTKANLHGTQCVHLGDTLWNADKATGLNSLTKKRKVLGDSVSSLQTWAREKQVEIHVCQHCLRDGFVTGSDQQALRTVDNAVSPAGASGSNPNALGNSLPFIVGGLYHRRDVFDVLGMQEHPSGGNWFTGYTTYGDDWFIFCGVGTGGRTGHDYGNHFDGDRLVWFAKTNTNLQQPSIKDLINPVGNVYVFFREGDRDPFTFAGLGKAVEVFDQTPVKVVWSFHGSAGVRLPTQLPEEIDDDEISTVTEGARRTVQVNVYERDPNARRKCIAKWGVKCSVCSFDFVERYGELGEGFIHVHHLKPLGEVGEQYELNPVTDLRPVCPNCHAMLHRKRPALGIEELVEILRQTEAPDALHRPND